MTFQTNRNFFSYLPINDDIISWNLYLTGTGFTEIPPRQTYPPPGHPELYHFRWRQGRILAEYQAIFISRGQGILETASTGPLPIASNTLILLFPGIWHRYRPNPQTGWTEHWISMNGEYLYQLCKRKVLDAGQPILPISAPQTLLETFDRIRSAVQKPHPENSLRYSAMGLEIFAAAIERKTDAKPARPESASTPSPAVEDEIVSAALQKIWNHSHRNLSVDALVRELPVTRRTLERKFQKSLRRSIGREILVCKLARAKNMLLHTELPVSHIALAAGFTTPEQFCKSFRSQEHTSPGKFRKSALGG